MTRYAIGLLGWGTVGGGVLQLLDDDGAGLGERCGLDIWLKRIVTRDPNRQRQQGLPANCEISSDITEITNDADIQCVLHLVGGTTAAKDLALACITAGKHVVTANKALLAEHGDELFAAAAEAGVSLAFEAAVAGSIPVIAALRDGLVANRIDGIQGILNGTCNYMLSQMEEHGLDYNTALDQAKELGYAEADPTLDVNGTDTAHKLAILARIAFAAPIDFGELRIEGIEDITAEDIASAKRLGCRIKLLGVARKQEKGIELRVTPTLVPLQSQLAGVMLNYNAVQILAHAAGPTLLVGQGAGDLPTASAVLADLVDVATGRYQQTAKRFAFFQSGANATVLASTEEYSAFYARFTVADEAGVLAKICQILSNAGVSLRSVHQSDSNTAGAATIEITTHPCSSGDFHAAIASIDELSCSLDATIIWHML